MLAKRLFRLFFLSLVTLIEMASVSGCVHAQSGRRGEEIGKPPKLEAKLIMYKNQYLLREPIWVKVQVTNVGKEAGKFSFVSFDGLVIKDSKGKNYPSNTTWEYAPITIKPQETREQEFDILGEYGIPEDSFHVRWYLPPEKYTVVYSLRKDVKSEVCTLLISLPEGDELKAMNLLKESHDLRIQKKNKEALDKLKELVQKYPKSRYYLSALLMTAGSLEAWYDLIKRFPDSREVVQAVGSIALTYEYKKDKQGFINAMKGLTKNYPNTDVATEAENRLKQMKDKDFE